ncbi:T9SS type A sorting domain-containing protein [Flavobacterium piscinae]|uniref:T9SS type A sorting domain-containing protein n=1 Tax=Flavobacterium piscinae TaxID=2506424 RepID=A0A4Q1KZS1_9FLAO|nr:T9SS type A sorting domain-containing protein [Flavobacterium piscinae]RXR35375.1 T9SS type A sorting domain-containing protein [Flavobacterium piscinae]
MKSNHINRFIFSFLFSFSLISNAQNNTCDVTEQCIYTVLLESLDNSGWNGNSMTFYQNGEAIKTIGLNFVDGSMFSDTVFLCDSSPFELVWNEGGNHPEQIKLRVISSFEQTIFTKNYGEGNPNSIIFSGISNCTTDCCFFWPFNLEFISSTETTALLSWGTDYNPQQYDIFLTTDLSENAQSNSSFITVNSNPAAISNLLPCTNYKYQVRYRCSELEQGLWSTESVLFSTECGLNLDENLFENLKVFPNPVVDFLSISNSSEINEIEIISALGQRIILLKINQQQTTLDLSILTSGIYFLKLISVEDYETIKIIKR